MGALSSVAPAATPAPSASGETSAPGDLSGSLREIAERAVVAAERAAIRAALDACAGNKAAAARRLQTDYKTLYLKMKRYGF